MSGLSGGSVRILWDASDSASVTITDPVGGSAVFTVDGSPATFPYTLSETTVFSTTRSGRYAVSVEYQSAEIAATPDGVRYVELAFGAQDTFAPSLDLGRAGVGGGGTTPSSAFSPLKAMLAEAGSRPVAIQVIGDSTGNDVTEWPRLLANHIRATIPAYTVQEVVYNVATETSPPPTVLQTGTAGAQYLSVVSGQTTPAIPQASAPAFPAVLDLRIKMAADDWTTSTGGAVIMGRENGAGQRSWYVSLAATGYPQIVVSSDGTALTTMHNGGFAVPFADGATGWLRFLYTCNDGAGNRVLKTYTSSDGVTWTQLGTTTTTAGAITPFSPSNANLTIGGRGGGSGLPGKIYEVHMLNAENGADLVPPLPGSWPMTPTGTPMSIVGAPVLTLVNGSYSGANAAILSDSTRLAKMTPNYGQKIAFISDSHNEGGLVDAAFIATYDALVEAVRTRLPGVPMVLLTQNPENGATNQVAHAARRWNIVTYGQAKGHETRDTFKAISNDPRGVPALMTDTLHPNADGSAVWAEVITDAYDDATT